MITKDHSTNFSNQIPTSGALPLSPTNNYLFHEIFRRNPKALREFLCALLKISSEEITSITFENPILNGDSPNQKYVILDIRLCTNNNSMINIEMQVWNEHNWPERSIIYISRMMGNIEKGTPYQNMPDIIHIGIHNFSLFEDNHEFFSTYQLLNVKNYQKYSDKIRICVLNLTQIHMATEEDKAFKLDLWASFFKAKTWEELHMLAQKDDSIHDLIVTYHDLTADEVERRNAFFEKERIRAENSLRYEIQLRDEQLHKKEEQLHKKDEQLHKKDEQLQIQEMEIDNLKKQLAEARKA